MDRTNKARTKISSSPFANKQFLLIFTIAFMVYMSSTMLSQTLPKYANDLGATAQAVGLLAGMFQIAALSMRPISGQIVDNEKRLKLLRIILCGVLVSVIGFTFSTNYWMLFIFRALHGLSWGIGSTLMMTVAASCFPDDKMTAGIGVYGLGQVMAQTIAPTFALPVALHLGYNTLYIGNIVLIAACLLTTVFLKIENPAPKERNYVYNLKKMVYWPAFLPATMTMVNSIAKASIQAFLIIFAGTMDITNIGMYFTVQAITIFITRPILSRMADRHGHMHILIPCEIMTIAGLALISYAHGLPMFLLASVIIGMGTSGEQPILMSECVKSAPPEKRGNASNTSYVGTDIGGFLGSNLAGTVVAAFGYRMMFRFFMIPVIAMTTIYLILNVRKKRSVTAVQTNQSPKA